MNDQSNQPVSLIGEQFGKYILIRLLDKSGKVYLAQRSDSPDIKAVIKILDEEIGLQEARIAFELRHPHIVRVLDFGIENNIPFFVMEYIAGGTLREYSAQKKLSLQEGITYIKQVAGALQYAHNRGVIHRDVKPENILIGDNGEALLNDFGIAVRPNEIPYKTIQDPDKLGIGTLTYMAPERFKSETHPASDQYALGIVFYELLGGEPPFQGDRYAIAAQHMTQSPPPLRKKNPDVPLAVEEVMMKALAKEPRDRFPSVQAFADALEEATLHGVAHVSNYDTVLTRINSSIKATGHSPTRRKVVMGIGLGVGTAATLGVYEIATWIAGHNTSQARALRGTPVTSAPTIGTLVAKYKHDNIVTAVALSPDGKRVVSADIEGNIQIRAVDSGTLLAEHTNYRQSVEAITWSITGERIAYASGDGRLHLLDAVTGDSYGEPYDPGHPEQAFAVAWWGEHLFVGLGNVVMVFDDVLNREFGDKDSAYQRHTGLVNAISCSPDQKNTIVASASDDLTVQLWTAETSTFVFSYKQHTGEVRTVAWSPDGRLIASGSSDRTTHVWHAQGTDIGTILIPYSGHTGAVNAVAWADDSQHIASGSDDGTVQLWRVSDGSVIHVYKGHTGSVNAVAWSRHGLVVSGGHDQTVQVWRAI